MDKENEKMELQYRRAEGKIEVRMTNDYLFRALMQKNEEVCKAFVGALLHLEDGQIRTAKVDNPIELGASIDNKEFFLDVKIRLNDYSIVNLEMQVINEHNWPERSMQYMCRAFDNVNRGGNHLDVRPVVQVCLLDFSLWEGDEEFYATYKLMNEKTHRAYSEKLQLKVMELKKAALATEEDRKWKLDIWGSFFKSNTWEELKALAEQLPILEEAAQTVYRVTQDERIRQQCEAREEYYRIQRTNQLLMEMKDRKLEEQSKQLMEKDEALQQKDEALQQKDEVIQQKDEVIQQKDEVIQQKDEQLKKIQKILISDAFQRGMSLEEAAAHTGLSVDEINHIKNQ